MVKSCSILSFIFFALSTTVHCDDAIKLRREIMDMQDHARVLAQDNEGLAQKIGKLQRKCEANLEPLKRKQELVHQQNLVEVEKLTAISDKIIQKSEEERLLNLALQRAFVHNKKYTLQIMLLTEELEVMGGRKQKGVADMCRRSKGLFHKYESVLSLRSSGSYRLGPKSKKNEVVVLHNELNQEKLKVQGLLNRNKELRADIDGIGRRCDMQILELQDLLAKSQDDLKEALKNIDMFQLELQESESVVQDLNSQLNNMNKSNALLKDKAGQLKLMLEGFNQDMECYKKLTQLHIFI